MKVRSTRVKSGAKILVRTGAMFSMTLCFASTSQVAITVAPAAPQGTIQRCTWDSGLIPMAWKSANVRPMSTPPPRAIKTK